MKDTIRLTILFDYYEKLLSEKDREIFKSYYFDNLSLGEISEDVVSRNAVHKRLKKVEEKLNYYEEKLKLYEKEKKLLLLIDDDFLKEKVKEILNL